MFDRAAGSRRHPPAPGKDAREPGHRRPTARCPRPRTGRCAAPPPPRAALLPARTGTDASWQFRCAPAPARRPRSPPDVAHRPSTRTRTRLALPRRSESGLQSTRACRRTRSDEGRRQEDRSWRTCGAHRLTVPRETQPRGPPLAQITASRLPHAEEPRPHRPRPADEAPHARRPQPVPTRLATGDAALHSQNHRTRRTTARRRRRLARFRVAPPHGSTPRTSSGTLYLLPVTAPGGRRTRCQQRSIAAPVVVPSEASRYARARRIVRATPPGPGGAPACAHAAARREQPADRPPRARSSTALDLAARRRRRRRQRC